MPPGYLLVLDKVFVITSFLASLAWVVQYSREGGWSNPLGHTILLKSSIICALCLIGMADLGQSSKRDIHCRSPQRMWVNVPWIEPQKAPREARRSASESRAAAPKSRRFISALYSAIVRT